MLVSSWWGKVFAEINLEQRHLFSPKGQHVGDIAAPGLPRGLIVAVTVLYGRELAPPPTTGFTTWCLSSKFILVVAC